MQMVMTFKTRSLFFFFCFFFSGVSLLKTKIIYLHIVNLSPPTRASWGFFSQMLNSHSSWIFSKELIASLLKHFFFTTHFKWWPLVHIFYGKRIFSFYARRLATCIQCLKNEKGLLLSGSAARQSTRLASRRSSHSSDTSLKVALYSVVLRRSSRFDNGEYPF